MATLHCVGHAVQDFVFRLDVLPERAVKYQAAGFASVGGGPAATAAVAARKLGLDVALHARVGADPVADVIAQELADYGVDVSALIRLEGAQSSLSSVYIDAAGERQIVNHRPSWPDAVEKLPHALSAETRVVLADTRWPAGALHMLELARARGCVGLLDGDLPVPRDGALVRAATHIAFSKEGLSAYTDEEDAGRALEKVARETSAWCGVTMGGEGVLMLDADAGTVQHVPAFKVAPVDTLGAGDVWHGAFAVALAEGLEALPAVQFASAAAALKVTRPGGRHGAPTRAEVDEFLLEHRGVQG